MTVQVSHILRIRKKTLFGNYTIFRITILQKLKCVDTIPKRPGHESYRFLVVTRTAISQLLFKIMQNLAAKLFEAKIKNKSSNGDMGNFVHFGDQWP